MQISATAASRGFSHLLSRVGKGETVEIARHGELVAVITPPPQGMLSGTDLIALLKELPHPDKDFSKDVAGLSEVITPPENPWLS
ncbi:MAG: type II toxin-antitoxin system Phd/YefM family antitoxin [Candidatus Dormibacteraceae bacterium]